MSDEDPGIILERAGADFAAGRFAAAAEGFRVVIAAHPDIGELHINLGAALRATGDTAGAERAYRDAIRLLPDNPLAWFNLGNLLRERKSHREALDAYTRADRLKPETPEFLNNLGVQLYETGDIEAALDKYEAALTVQPGFADAMTNRGNALQRLGRMDEAGESIDAALTSNPHHAVYRLNKASYLAANGRHTAALEWADRALAADPAYTEARLKKASLLIQTGDLAAGFRDYEVRWTIPNWHPLPSKLPMPAWRGEDIAGKTLLLWNEQGYGDALIYARYIPILMARGVKPLLMCEEPLWRLFETSFGDGLAVHSLDGSPPDADVHASLMSLPHLMGTTLATIPAAVPYLHGNAEETARWRATVAGGSPAVGIVWAGNPGQAHDYSRSMAPETVLPLLDRTDVRFFNLLVGPRGDELAHPNLADIRDRLDDFAATAALMQALDLVISVDSAPAHLAGALARPLWVMLAFDPDSRYFLGRDDSPWYPTANLIRQPHPGDWDAAMKSAGSALDDFISAKAKR